MSNSTRPVSLGRLAEALAQLSVQRPADRAKVLAALELDEAALTEARFEVGRAIAASLESGDVGSILKFASVFQRTERRARLQRTAALEVRSEVQEDIGRVMPTIRRRAMRPLDIPARPSEIASESSAPRDLPSYLQKLESYSEGDGTDREPAGQAHPAPARAPDPDLTRAPTCGMAPPSLPFRRPTSTELEHPAPAAEPLAPQPGDESGETVLLPDAADRASQGLPFEHGQLLELKHYVALAAQLRAEPDRSSEILRQFGVEAPKARAQVHALWQVRFEKNPSLKQDFEARVADALAAWRKRQSSEQ